MSRLGTEAGRRTKSLEVKTLMVICHEQCVVRGSLVGPKPIPLVNVPGPSKDKPRNAMASSQPVEFKRLERQPVRQRLEAKWPGRGRKQSQREVSGVKVSVMVSCGCGLDTQALAKTKERSTLDGAWDVTGYYVTAIHGCCPCLLRVLGVPQRPLLDSSVSLKCPLQALCECP